MLAAMLCSHPPVVLSALTPHLPPHTHTLRATYKFNSIEFYLSISRTLRYTRNIVSTVRSSSSDPNCEAADADIETADRLLNELLQSAEDRARRNHRETGGVEAAPTKMAILLSKLLTHKCS
jgi:hypothetical protein